MRRAALLLAVLMAGSACSMAPRYERGAAPVPPQWPTGEAYGSATGGHVASSPQTASIFTDPRLSRLLDSARQNNRDLRIAAANIAEARARLRQQRGAQFPVIGASADASVRDGEGQPRVRSYGVQAGITSFELDLFGRLASLTRAEQERVLASEAAARTVRLGLFADIALVWSTYAADADLLGIARETEESAARTVALTRARLEGGIASRIDMLQAEQVLATAQGDVASLHTALAQDVNLLQLLIGAPVDRALLPQGLSEAEGGIATAQAGLESNILLTRPDVMEAEYLLRSAQAEIGAARATLFPRISLTGALGFASDALGALFRNGAFAWSAAGAADYAIFSGGSGRASLTASKARRDAALAAYEKSIQTAFREVADALARRGTLDRELRAAQVLAAAASDTARLTDMRYRGGIESFLASLDARRSDYSAQRSLVAVRLDEVANRIALYRALGGSERMPDPSQ